MHRDLTPCVAHALKPLNTPQVEWAFGHLYNVWESLRFLPLKKLGITPIGTIVQVCVLLTNFRTCMRGGNQISYYFDTSPPTLAEYLDAPIPEPTRADAHHAAQEEAIRMLGEALA